MTPERATKHTAEPVAVSNAPSGAELPAWHDTLGRVVDLLATLQEQVAQIDVDGARSAEADAGSAARDLLLRDIEAARLAARDAQRRVADAFVGPAAQPDAARA